MKEDNLPTPKAAPSDPPPDQANQTALEFPASGPPVMSDGGDAKGSSGPDEDHAGLSRRRFLTSLAVMSAAVGLGTQFVRNSSASAATTTTTQPASLGGTTKAPLPQWTMVMDLRYCIGCKDCTTACQYAHVLPKDTEWIKVYTMTDPTGQDYHLPRVCQMCEDPPCQAVCPVGATFRTDEGLVLIDQDVCIGCRTCMAACPFEARYFNTAPTPKVPPQPFPPSPEWPVPQLTNTVGKCVLCAAKLTAGEVPACVTGCGKGVIYIGDETSDLAINSHGNIVKLSNFVKENDAFHLKEELGTNPRVWYIPGHGQDYKSY